MRRSRRRGIQAESRHQGFIYETVKKGLEHFKALFGQHSSFQYLPEVARWERWRFTYYGIVHPLAREGLGVSLMSVADFARYLKVPEAEVKDYSQQGHQAFREHFAGWEFLEYQVSELFPLERWYGSVESLGEQPEDQAANRD